ncbi:hypothetical protein CVT24_000866 [Panaeolus cyanescens]|uniref:Nuclear protein DGCR14 n=1 Tax=Panaeolus cyanescens TaxID=181874 RepID=A0A409YCC7_9AGAR|nr:hypothetical protein CVT24_000866 [Panaeolus cyanescens]
MPTETQRQERSLSNQTVLEEEEYTAALSHIIARDFFPSLVPLQATNQYLDAVETRDPHLINASVRYLQEVSLTPAMHKRTKPPQTPSETPYGYMGDTPARVPTTATGEPPQKRPRYNTDMSLDNFQAKFTSEDNSSFTQILNEENSARKERYGWAYDAQRRVEAQRDKMIEGRETMLLEAPQPTGVRGRIVIERPTVSGLIAAESHNSGEECKVDDQDQKVQTQDLVLLKQSEGNASDVMAPAKDTRSAGVDGWKFRARNSLMFAPDADISPYDHPEPETTVVNDSKEINYSSTRLDEHTVGDATSTSAPPSPTRSRIDAAITGTPYQPRSKEEGFTLVPNLPSPTAAELGPTAIKQLMTWGTLQSTPRILGQSDDTGDIRTPFHIPAVTSREELSHKLSSKAAKSLRAKADMLAGKTPASRRGTMAPPSWTPRRADAPGSLTPAAQRLLQRTTMGVAATRRADAMERTAGWENSKGKERDLAQTRWTPTPTSIGRR